MIDPKQQSLGSDIKNFHVVKGGNQTELNLNQTEFDSEQTKWNEINKKKKKSINNIKYSQINVHIVYFFCLLPDIKYF